MLFQVKQGEWQKVYENAIWFVNEDSRKAFTEYCRNLKGTQMIQWLFGNHLFELKNHEE